MSLIRRLEELYAALRDKPTSAVRSWTPGQGTPDIPEDPEIIEVGELPFMIIGHPYLGALPADPNEERYQLG